MRMCVSAEVGGGELSLSHCLCMRESIDEMKKEEMCENGGK